MNFDANGPSYPGGDALLRFTPVGSYLEYIRECRVSLDLVDHENDLVGSLSLSSAPLWFTRPLLYGVYARTVQVQYSISMVLCIEVVLMEYSPTSGYALASSPLVLAICGKYVKADAFLWLDIMGLAVSSLL
jgi:hypothetical protein